MKEQSSILKDVEANSSLAKLRAAALLWLSTRQSLLYVLSSAAGAWMTDDDDHGDALELLTEMRCYAKAMRDAADEIVLAEESERLIWEVLTEQATLYEHVFEIPWDKGLQQ
jgi:hypothetical protein